jgi:hypothetical protein
MRSLLTYLQDNKVSGTSSTGNFSQKAVKDLVEKIGYSHPLLDKDEFSRMFKNEDDVWAVYFIHLMAYWAELITGGKGKLWKLTPKGETFLESPPAEQLHHLFMGWWFRGNWLVTRNSYNRLEYLHYTFPRFIHKLLTSSLASQSMDFVKFSKRILDAMGFYEDPVPENIQFQRLMDDIEETIIKPLEALGFIIGKREEKLLYGSIKSELLVSFQLSDFGREAFRTMIDASLYRELKAKLN